MDFLVNLDIIAIWEQLHSMALGAFSEFAIGIILAFLLWAISLILEPRDEGKKALYFLRIISFWLILILCFQL